MKKIMLSAVISSLCFVVPVLALSTLPMNKTTPVLQSSPLSADPFNVTVNTVKFDGPSGPLLVTVTWHAIYHPESNCYEGLFTIQNNTTKRLYNITVWKERTGDLQTDPYSLTLEPYETKNFHLLSPCESEPPTTMQLMVEFDNPDSTSFDCRLYTLSPEKPNTPSASTEGVQ